MRVEFLGVSGAGKTTIATGLVDSLPDAVSLQDAALGAIRAQGEDDIARLVARVARSGSSSSWQHAYVRSTDRFSALVRFLSDHPRLLPPALEAQERRSGRDFSPELALGWLLNLMASYQLAVELPGQRDIVIDEGFCQRAVALFGFGYDVADEPQLKRFVESAPIADVVVVVEAPLDLCARRLEGRGWSARIGHLPTDERLAALAGAAEVVHQVDHLLEQKGVELIRVEGVGAPEDRVAEVLEMLRGRGSVA